MQCEKDGLAAEECGVKTLPEGTRSKRKRITNAQLQEQVLALEEKVNNVTERMDEMTKKLDRVLGPSDNRPKSQIRYI